MILKIRIIDRIDCGDEAHTVTTWGKEFRVDYWFLGRHLDNLKKNLGYAFPVFALTATAVWNPRGGNDMF